MDGTATLKEACVPMKKPANRHAPEAIDPIHCLEESALRDAEKEMIPFILFWQSLPYLIIIDELRALDNKKRPTPPE